MYFWRVICIHLQSYNQEIVAKASLSPLDNGLLHHEFFIAGYHSEEKKNLAY